MNIQFRSPAVYWTEALPIGNGKLGAMVFGGVEKERLALNEDTLWSGHPSDWNNPGAKEVLPKVRELIAQEKYEEADHLCKIRGLRGRGGYEVDLKWANGVLVKAVIAASITQTCELDAKTDIRITQDGEEVEGIQTENGRVRFHTEGGKRYDINVI